MAFDPNNPTFYGSCLPVDFARDVTGGAIGSKFTGKASDRDGDALRYLYNDTFHQWFDSGDRALIGFYPERGMLTLADAVEFHLVVELRDDSTGTFRLSAGVDPDFTLTRSDLATESLGTFDAAGSFTAGGRSQIVVPVSSWTGAMIHAGQGEPFIHLEALTGRPRIMQTRVRMWPVGGVTGTWETDPDYVIEDVRPRFLLSDGVADMADTAIEGQSLGSHGPRNHNPGPGLWGGFDDHGDTAAAFVEMADWLVGHGLPPYQSFQWSSFSPGSISGGYAFTWTLRQFADPSHDWTGGYDAAMVLIVADPVVTDSRQNGLTYDDPDRVPGDASTVRDGRTGGPLGSTFVAWESQPELSPSGSPNGELVGVRSFSLATEPWAETSSGIADTGASYEFYLAKFGIDTGPGAPPKPGATQVPIPGSPIVGVEVNGAHTGSLGMYEFDSTLGFSAVAAGSRTVTFENVRATHRYEDVQWYNPGGVAKPTRKPRFYVTYTEVEDEPHAVSHVVGIGKPADDASLFRVPTPLGMLRELRHGETVSDVSVAYPLKVKLFDGSWTVVAGMTLDD